MSGSGVMTGLKTIRQSIKSIQLAKNPNHTGKRPVYFFNLARFLSGNSDARHGLSNEMCVTCEGNLG